MKNILTIITKEIHQFRRDPKMFGIILLGPILQLIFFGYAVNMDLEKVSAVVFDKDKSVKSRLFIDEFTGSNYFEILDYTNSYDDVQKYLEGGKATLAIIIENKFEQNLSANRTAKVQVIFDGSDGNKASIAAGYVTNIFSDFSKNILLELQNKTGQKKTLISPIEAEIRAWFNPTLKTRNFMIPGIIGMLLSIITLILTSLAIVKEKEIGTLEQIIVTPIKPYELIIGKAIPFAAMGFIVISIILSVMTFGFNIPIKGSISFLFLSSAVYILSTLGLGIFVSTVSKTQQQAMMIAVFVVMMPMVFLSGFAFPIENMPVIIQQITYIIPLRYFMTIIRSVILKGIGFNELWLELLIMLIMGIVLLILSSLRFRKNLD
jgi:ABC-2 type transport system permease protein